MALSRFADGHESGPKALVIGSETNLAAAVPYLQGSGNINIFGLVTEDERLVGSRIEGISICGHIASLPNLLATHPVELVIVAGTDMHGIDEVLRMAGEFGVQVRLLPSSADLLTGNVQVRRVIGIDHISSSSSGTSVAARISL